MPRRILFEFLYLLRRTPWDTHKTPPELSSYLESHAPGTALELGCGTGTNALTIARYSWDVTGVDISQLAIEQAKHRAAAASLPIRFLRQDVSHLKNVPSPFDLILDIGCFHSLTKGGKNSYLLQIRELLAPGGTFLLYMHINPANSPDGTLPSINGLRRQLQHCCSLEQVEHGTDRGWRRSSAWLTFRRRPA